MSNILFITSQIFDKDLYEAFSKVKNEGHKLYLLSDGRNLPDAGVFEEQYVYDLRNVTAVLEGMRKTDISFGAVVQQSSDYLTPLTALLARHYGCKGNTPKTAFLCRSKYHMRKALEGAGVPIPKFRLCQNYDEIENAVSDIGMPCVVKPVGANSSMGVFGIMSKKDLHELKARYDLALDSLKNATGNDIFAFSREELKSIGIEDYIDMGNDFLVEEYMEGPEISIDALVHQNEITIMCIEDQIRMAPPYFLQTEARMPYQTTSEQMGVIKNLVEKTIRALGIQDSASHTEIIFTPDGPKIVEIGCRFGGDDILSSIKVVTGYNLLYETIQIALGKHREYNVKTLAHTAMMYFMPKERGTIQSIKVPEKLAEDPRIVEFFIFLSKGHFVAPPPESFEYIGYMNVKGHTAEEARRSLMELSSQIKIEIKE